MWSSAGLASKTYRLRRSAFSSSVKLVFEAFVDSNLEAVEFYVRVHFLTAAPSQPANDLVCGGFQSGSCPRVTKFAFAFCQSMTKLLIGAPAALQNAGIRNGKTEARAAQLR